MPALRAATMQCEAISALASATRASGMTDAWFAARLNCGREHFNRIKNGKTSPEWGLFCRWAALLGARVVIVGAHADD